MSRLLLFLILAVVVYLWLKKLVAPRPAASDGRKAIPESMLKCARCGVHFPASEAIARNGSVYCSRPHAEGGNP